MTVIADDATFAASAEPYRRELHVHSYRMLGSFEEAEDAVQETLLRAWRSRETFDGTSFRAWLYKIATNVCLDQIRRNNRRPLSHSFDSLGEVPWLQPYPDQLLDEVAPREEEPEAAAVQRETIELAFLAAIQLLPPRQRAVLILREVVEWSAKETAGLLDMSVPAVNSALQRARATLAAHRPHGRVGRPPPDVTPEERALLERSIAAHEAADVHGPRRDAPGRRADAMPPLPFWFNDKATFLPGLGPGLREPGEWRLVAVRAQPHARLGDVSAAVGRDGVPAIQDRRHAHGGGLVAEITTFDARLFPAFGLPPTPPER